MEQRSTQILLFLFPALATVAVVALAGIFPFIARSDDLVYFAFLLPLPWIFSFLSQENPSIGWRLALAVAYYFLSLLAVFIVGWVAIGMLIPGSR